MYDICLFTIASIPDTVQAQTQADLLAVNLVTSCSTVLHACFVLIFLNNVLFS